MINFFFKKPKVILDCFTFDECIAKATPVDFSLKHFPEWWKKLPKSIMPEQGFYDLPTMKTCSGLVDYYKNSITLPMWSDLAICVKNKQYTWQFADRETEGEVHNINQRSGFLPVDRFGHLKISSPWIFKTKENINWIWSHAVYNFECPDDFIVLPGSVNYSKINSTHINLAIPLETNKLINIEIGQPMIHISPMTEKNIEIKRHVVSKEEFNRLDIYKNKKTFVNSFLKNQNLEKKFNKCPYEMDK